MEWLLYVVAACFFIVAAVCVALVVLQLPGGWIILALAVVIEWIDGLYLPPERQPTFPVWLLVATFGLLVIGEIVEFVASAEGARRGGSSRRGMVGALIGGVVGAILLTPPLLFIPVVGTLLGAVIGTFVGAVVGEITAQQPRTMKQSLRPATGAAIGRVMGTVSKVGIAIAIWLTLTMAAIWP
jgi:uncharacterized protein YqgC (DUF456 family)